VVLEVAENMGRGKTRQPQQQLLLTLLGLIGLAAMQMAAEARPMSPGRDLLAARPYGVAVNASRNQFVQV
jgi:hypothetical protein